MTEPPETKTDFQKGLALANRLWESAVGKLFDEFHVETTYLLCGKCGQKYQVPTPMPEGRIACPVCLRENKESVGICRVVTRSSPINNGEWQREVLAATELKGAARALLELISNNLPLTDVLVGRLRRACDYYDDSEKRGWSQTILPIIRAHDLVVLNNDVPLQQYTGTKGAA